MTFTPYFPIMKKFLIVSTLLVAIIFAGCSKTPVTETENTSTFSLIGNQVTKYPYMRKMEKPEIGQMTNRDAIQNGYHESWKMKYTLPEVNTSDPIFEQECGKEGMQLISAEDRALIKKIPLKQFTTNASFDLEGTYDGP